MDEQTPRPVFLERASYHQRRVADAARVVPVLGGVLVMLPLLWPEVDEGDGGVGTASAFLYIFGVWALMIAAGALMARWLKQDQKEG